MTPRSHTMKAARQKSIWGKVMQRFRKNRLAVFAYRIVLFLTLVAIFADFIAYNKPFYAVYQGETYYPLFNDYAEKLGLYQWDGDLIHAEWRELEYDGEITSSFWPPVRYNPEDIDYDNQELLSPFEDQYVEHWKFWHFLGTNRDGRDVLSGLVHGTRISLTIGLVAMGIAALLGILFGSLAGYFGDNRLQLSRIGIVFLILGLFLGFFYGFQVRLPALQDALSGGGTGIIFQMLFSLIIMLAVIFGMVFLARPLEFIPWLGRKRYLWLDIFISRFIEIWGSIPLLLLIITISALMDKKNLYLIMVLIGFFSWTGVARFMRGEMLRVRSQSFVEAARSLGLTEFRTMFRHALPNALAPVLVVMAFGVASAIVLEAALSFLGVGVPDNVITWGKLLREASDDISAWWLVVFPSFTVFLTVTALNLLGDGLRDALDPKTSQEG